MRACAETDDRFGAWRWRSLADLLALSCAACRPAGRQYELKGQILAVDPARQELTIKHQDIPGFMPGMTMAFKVGDAASDGRIAIAGELVTATLVVNDGEAHLRAVTRTGFAAVERRPRRHSRDGPGRTRTTPSAMRRSSTRPAPGGTLADWRGRVAGRHVRIHAMSAAQLLSAPGPTLQGRADPGAGRRQSARSASSCSRSASIRNTIRRRSWRSGRPRWGRSRGLALPDRRRAEVETFAAQFGVSVVRDASPPDAIEHNLRTAIIDGEGTLVTTLSGSEWTPATW